MQPDLERILSNTPGLEGKDFDPLALIRSVNALHPLGKEGALNAIAHFLNKFSGGFIGFDTGQSMFLVLRCLFDVPDPPGFMPPMRVGAPDPPEPSNRRLLPYFPLVIIGDIPLMLVWGYSLFGVPEPPMEHVKYFRQAGKLRAKLLTPTNQPIDIVAQLESSPQWLWGKQYEAYGMKDRTRNLNPVWAVQEREQGQDLVRSQLLRLLASVYPLGLDALGWGQRRDQYLREERWQKIVEDVWLLRLRWDAGRQDYVR
jgi:hypothetical protein